MTEQLPPGSWPWLHIVARWVGRWIFRAPYRLRVRGRERVPRTGPVVVVVNHSTMLDGPITLGMLGRPAVFLIKQEMFRGLLGVLLLRIGQISISRESPGREPLMSAVRILRAGGLIAVFPEGHRGAGKVTEASNGAAWLARTAGAQVLPIAVRGTLRGPGQRGLGRRIDVLVGKPFEPAERRGRAGLAEATEQIRAALADLVTELDLVRDGRDGGRGTEGKWENTGE
ncbi:MAG TPA: lysophospholipid acyltransferase family protein [Pseudonocardiaceae bacterium]|nr:lysophospholipid acyltransferase family protein [Pseudonocardiaceae bacterium]